MQHRYISLDGLRGTAALLVLGHHLQNEIGGAGLFGRGFLSVDFFFLLSGFVVASAYERRLLGGMSLLDFGRVRLLRLYPLMFLGALVATTLAVVIGGLGSISAPMVVGQFLLLPGLGDSTTLFALNTVYWSLLFELVANFLYALMIRWATTKALVLWVAIAALGIIFTAMRMHHLGGGWSTHNWWAGLARVGFSFPAGVLLYRLHLENRLPLVRLPFPVVTGFLCASIVAAGLINHWAIDTLAVLCAFPVLLVLGVHAPAGGFSGVATWLGAISYALYAIHEPIVRAWGALAPTTFFSALLIAATCIVLAAIAERWFDGPVRRSLANLLSSRQPAVGNQT